MWKKWIKGLLLLAIAVICPVWFADAHEILVEEQLDSCLGRFEHAQDFPDEKGSIKIMGSVYLKYTAEDTKLLVLEWRNIVNASNKYISVYDEQDREILISTYEQRVTLYLQKGYTYYFEIDIGEADLDYELCDRSDSTISAITVEYMPRLIGYKEWYSAGGRFVYPPALESLKLRIEYSNGKVVSKKFDQNGVDWLSYGLESYNWVKLDREGTYYIIVLYKGKPVEIPYIVRSLESIQAKQIDVEKDILVPYCDGDWNGYAFIPEETGFYNINCMVSGKSYFFLCNRERGCMMYGTTSSYTGGKSFTKNYLQAGKTYYLYAGVAQPGGKARFKITKVMTTGYAGLQAASVEDVSYTGTVHRPTPAVIYKGTDFVAGGGIVEYKYYDNIEPGEALVAIHCKHEDIWKEEILYVPFNILWPVADAEVTVPKCSYTGKAVIPEVTVKIKDKVLVKDKDFTVTAVNNVNAGTATMTITGIGKCEGSLKKNFTINKAVQEIEGKHTFIKNRKSKSFRLGAKSKGKLSYRSGDRKVAAVDRKGKVKIRGYGKTVVTIKAAGDRNHKRSAKKVTVVVTSRKGKVRSVKSGKKGQAVVTLQEVKDAHGYEISYSLDAEFGTGVKKLCVNSPEAVLKKLKSKKTYYVRVRTYRREKGKRLYSEYSKAKKVKIR